MYSACSHIGPQYKGSLSLSLPYFSSCACPAFAKRPFQGFRVGRVEDIKVETTDLALLSVKGMASRKAVKGWVLFSHIQTPRCLQSFEMLTGGVHWINMFAARHTRLVSNAPLCIGLVIIVLEQHLEAPSQGSGLRIMRADSPCLKELTSEYRWSTSAVLGQSVLIMPTLWMPCESSKCCHLFAYWYSLNISRQHIDFPPNVPDW